MMYNENMKFMVLQSSSSGNSTLVENNGKYYLLDAGIGIKTFYKRISDAGMFIPALSGIFLTHEHSDHISGLVSLISKYKCQIYTTKLTYKNLPSDYKEKISPLNFSFFVPEKEFKVDDLTINTFRTFHDAIDPIGFRITDEFGKSLVYITDTGKLEPRIEIMNSNAYIIEANHEPDLLLMSARPHLLKMRIMGEYGHLSNEDSARLFQEIRGDNTHLLVLFHLSDECNSHELALLTYKKYFESIDESLDDVEIVISNKNKPTTLMEV